MSSVKRVYSDPHPNEAVGKCYVVYLYVDYRKEFGSHVLRTYSDKQKAIDFAESISTKFVWAKGRWVPDGPLKKEEDIGAEYYDGTGNVFDAWVRMEARQLIDAGILDRKWGWMFMLRVGIEEVNQY